MKATIEPVKPVEPDVTITLVCTNDELKLLWALFKCHSTVPQHLAARFVTDTEDVKPLKNLMSSVYAVLDRYFDTQM